ncbi:exodeoxyribonuclease VII small subunit [Ornithinimicrobium cavernae]|uniref:exodeoxyribonuclease VII small subunit n=1 Tax=Ornithinimicrobium cavernae TaxID=2666047 RepID=UPI000D68EF1E|nr:exodeoxyribonuclease VII small subunit [Ornithinimicrobium cavernae]
MSSDSTAGTPPVADLSYEEARDELVAIVSRIEGGSASLEESMELWERGEALAAHCQAKLDQAQEQLDRGATPSAAGDAGSQLGAESAPEDGGPLADDATDEDDTTDA